MHASVSAHIANEYLVDEEKEIWGQNLPEFIARLGNTAVKERIENMYFTYLFVLRAVIKAGPMLASIDYSTGCSDDDMLTKQLMQQVVSFAPYLFAWYKNGFCCPYCYLVLSYLLTYAALLLAFAQYTMRCLFLSRQNIQTEQSLLHTLWAFAIRLQEKNACRWGMML